MDELSKLAERCESGKGLDNALDVLVEVALFEPDEQTVAVRANNAGTKVIFMFADGRLGTYWAEEWTRDRPGTAAALRARARSLTPASDGEGASHG